VTKAADLGVHLVQFAENLPLDPLSLEELQAVRKVARDRDVEIEVGTRGLSRENVCRYLAIAQVLGATLVRIAVDRADLASTPIETGAPLVEVLPVCRQGHLRIAIENHLFVPSPFLADVVRAIDDPHVGVCLDTANSLVLWEWPMTTVERLVPYALSLHVKDFQAQPHPDGVGFHVVGVPLGHGSLDVEAVLAAVRAARRDLNVILEHWLPRADDERTTLEREELWLREGIAAARGLGIDL